MEGSKDQQILRKGQPLPFSDGLSSIIRIVSLRCLREL